MLGVLASVGAGTLYYHWYRAAFSETRSMWVGRGFTRDIPGWQDVAVPPLDLTTIDGDTIRLSDLKGRPVVLNFWATWCGPCRQEIPHLNRLARESHAGLVVIGVSDESEETLRSFGRKERLAYPVVSAGDLPPPFDGVRAFPTTAFIDRQGIIRKAVIGYQDYETLKARALTR